MEQMRVGTTVATRKTPYHAWDVRDLKSNNAAKKANGLNSRKGNKLAAMLPCRRKADRRCEDRRVSETAVETDQRKADRRKFQRRA